jgi:hypothetical protein
MGYARVGHRYLSPEEVTIRSFLKMKNSKLIFYKDKGYCYIAENTADDIATDIAI